MKQVAPDGFEKTLQQKVGRLLVRDKHIQKRVQVQEFNQDEVSFL
jgi:hypothetical protein